MNEVAPHLEPDQNNPVRSESDSNPERPFWGLSDLQIAIIGAFSGWEFLFGGYLQEQFKYTNLNNFFEFMIYNVGDFNNSFFVTHIVYRAFLGSEYIGLPKESALSIASLISTLIFIYIERNDLIDIPAALIGVLVYQLTTFAAQEASKTKKT